LLAVVVVVVAIPLDDAIIQYCSVLLIIEEF